MKHSVLVHVAAASALLLPGAGDASIRSHYLYVRAGGPFDTDSTDELEMGTNVEKLTQVGVSGVNDFVHFAHAEVDSDRGLLLAENLIDWGAGAPTAESDAIAAIEQGLEFTDAGGDLTVRFDVDFTGAAEEIGTGLATAELRLDDGSCHLLVQIRGNDDPVIQDYCNDFAYRTYEKSVGPGGITMAVTYLSGHVPDGLAFLVQVTSHLQSGYNGSQIVSAFASAALSISVEGASSYSFVSPTFLTVPEPGDGALAAIALASLAACARHRTARAKPQPRAHSQRARAGRR